MTHSSANHCLTSTEFLSVSEPPRVSQTGMELGIFLDMILRYKMMFMDHTNHMARSVCHSDSCSTVCSCCSELMQLFQNLIFFEI